MIAKSYIRATLKHLNNQYNSKPSKLAGYLISKQAILELCGWIEESMDDIILRCSKKNLKSTKNTEQIEKAVKSNSGFHYHNNFRKILITIIGLTNIEKVEKELEFLPESTSTHQQFIASLDRLSKTRNSHAHTHVRGVTLHIDSPSASMANYKIILDGLENVERALRRKSFL